MNTENRIMELRNGSNAVRDYAQMVRKSFEYSGRRLDTPRKGVYDLTWGNRVFVRVRRRFNVLLEFETCCVDDFSALVREIRRRLGRESGLVEVYARNMTRGWSLTRPLRLYGQSIPQLPASSSVSGIEKLSAALPRTGAHRVPESVRLQFAH